MKIVIWGLHYSMNVGDGVIAECLGDCLKKAAPGVEVTTVDISGRHGFGEKMLANRTLALRILSALPVFLRQRVVIWRLGAMLRRLRPEWERAAAGAQLSVIGGGQIFSDADLNFCLKIAQVGEVLETRRMPVVVHAVGVSRNWSTRGRSLFRKLLKTDLRAVGIRDDLSRAAWIAQFGADGPAPAITRDPGLMAADCYGRPERQTDTIGICVTAPMILSYHSDGSVAGTGGSGEAFFANLALELTKAGHKVTLFCNGAEEDRESLERIALVPHVAALREKGQLKVADPPETPRELAHMIGGFDAVVAHRLHACIVAYAYGVPHIGLGWDNKLESFFASVDRLDSFVAAADAGPHEIAVLCEQVMAHGIDPQTHARVVAEARAQSVAVLSHLSGAAGSVGVADGDTEPGQIPV
ncbi:MAG: polysaccharide pyruvyl transferase family protein [Rhodobacteraceae bacterium]|nr:polysaccharide pyruvyl transferase family protein [Paracoccaceae bacterium]